MGAKEAIVLAILKMAQSEQDDFAQIEPLLIELKMAGVKNFTLIRSPEQDTLLHLCAKLNLEKTLVALSHYCMKNKIILDFGAVNIEGRTALHFASMYINVPMVKFLINRMQAQGRSIRQIDAFGMMPIHMAAACLYNASKISHRIAIETFLTDAGANLYDKVENSSITAFELAYIPDKPMITHRDIFGRTPAMKKICDVAVFYHKLNKTPHDFVEIKKLETQIKYLITQYANLRDARDRIGRSTLMYAIYLGCEPLVDFLIQQGVKVGFADKFGFTALHAAAFDYRGINTNIVNALLTAGAKDVPNVHGQKPSDIAMQYGMTEIAQMINTTISRARESSTDMIEELARVLRLTYITPAPSFSISFQGDHSQPNAIPFKSLLLLSKREGTYSEKRYSTDQSQISTFKLTNKY